MRFCSHYLVRGFQFLQRNFQIFLLNSIANGQFHFNSLNQTLAAAYPNFSGIPISTAVISPFFHVVLSPLLAGNRNPTIPSNIVRLLQMGRKIFRFPQMGIDEMSSNRISSWEIPPESGHRLKIHGSEKAHCNWGSSSIE